MLALLVPLSCLTGLPVCLHCTFLLNLKPKVFSLHTVVAEPKAVDKWSHHYLNQYFFSLQTNETFFLSVIVTVLVKKGFFQEKLMSYIKNNFIWSSVTVSFVLILILCNNKLLKCCCFWLHYVHIFINLKVKLKIWDTKNFAAAVESSLALFI